MVKLENFSGLTRKQEDLLAKQYPFHSLPVVTFTSKQDEFTFHTRASQRFADEETKILASTWLEFKKNLVTGKFKLRTDQLAHLTLECSPEKWVKNLKVKGEYKSTQGRDSTQTESSLAFDYSHEKCKAKVVVGGNPMYVKGNVTLGKPEYGIGFDGKFDVDSQRLHTYNAALWWLRKYSRLVFKHESTDKKEYNIGNLKTSYYQKVGSGHLGAAITTNWSTKQTTLDVGGDYRYDPLTLFKAKINSSGIVTASMVKTLSSTMTAVFAGQVPINQVNVNSVNGYKFGVHLDFKH